MPDDLTRLLCDPGRLAPWLDAQESEVGLEAGRPLSVERITTGHSNETFLVRRGGEIAQRAEEIVGPYELHDFFLYYFLRFGFGPRRIARMAVHAFEGRHALATIRRWLDVFLERFFANQFKRDCLPDAPKVGSGGSLSPRGDWRMPSDAQVQGWLRWLDARAG